MLPTFYHDGLVLLVHLSVGDFEGRGDGEPRGGKQEPCCSPHPVSVLQLLLLETAPLPDRLPCWNHQGWRRGATASKGFSSEGCWQAWGVPGLKRRSSPSCSQCFDGFISKTNHEFRAKIVRNLLILSFALMGRHSINAEVQNMS